MTMYHDMNCHSHAVALVWSAVFRHNWLNSLVEPITVRTVNVQTVSPRNLPLRKITYINICTMDAKQHHPKCNLCESCRERCLEQRFHTVAISTSENHQTPIWILTRVAIHGVARNVFPTYQIIHHPERWPQQTNLIAAWHSWRQCFDNNS